MRRSVAPARPPAARPALGAVLAAALLVAACGSTATPSPSGGSGGPTASGPSAAAGSPTPAPTPLPQTSAIAAFVALVTADGFSYQATFTGESRHTTVILPISKGLLQVHGDDVLVRATFTYPHSRSYMVEHRWVGGKGWIRYDPSLPWKRLSMTAVQTMAAFASVHAPSDVQYVQPVTKAGKTLYQVTIKSAIVNPVMIPASNLTEEVVTKPKLTLLIDAAGRPVSGTAEIGGTGRVSQQLQEIVIDLTIAFTKVGQAVTIAAP